MTTQPSSDLSQLSGVLPFMMDSTERKALLRGRLARVDAVATSILARHDYPQAVAELSAESIALAACLSSTMDFDGVFTLQAKGDRTSARSSLMSPQRERFELTRKSPMILMPPPHWATPRH